MQIKKLMFNVFWLYISHTILDSTKI